MDKAGVWLNQKEAYVVRIGERGTVTLNYLTSKVEHNTKAIGGKFTKAPNASTAGSGHLELKLHERRNHEFAEYFKAIKSELKKVSSVFILGPGPAKFKLANYLADEKQLSKKIQGVLTTDKLTKNQILGEIVGLYELKPPRKGPTKKN